MVWEHPNCHWKAKTALCLPRVCMIGCLWEFENSDKVKINNVSTKTDLQLLTVHFLFKNKKVSSSSTPVVRVSPVNC
ncbi:hypothetical protein KOW79_004849 [Hemibagrus wyckioides]|uniref:Uncharacterized protein n=1 Tax=Hemibagrus wyckioides TaxID=337641 RepID=A0A9D3NXT9_9TELE|nr:hypothetical protein KOW79_004849 [Hemibagrus wyckioides]